MFPSVRDRANGVRDVVLLSPRTVRRIALLVHLVVFSEDNAKVKVGVLLLSGAQLLSVLRSEVPLDLDVSLVAIRKCDDKVWVVVTVEDKSVRDLLSLVRQLGLGSS